MKSFEDIDVLIGGWVCFVGSSIRKGETSGRIIYSLVHNAEFGERASEILAKVNADQDTGQSRQVAAIIRSAAKRCLRKMEIAAAINNPLFGRFA